jgi:hypothetical protein
MGCRGSAAEKEQGQWHRWTEKLGAEKETKIFYYLEQMLSRMGSNVACDIKHVGLEHSVIMFCSLSWYNAVLLYHVVMYVIISGVGKLCCHVLLSCHVIMSCF